MLHEELIAIIEMPVFCGGLKPPLYVLYFAEKSLKMTAWQPGIGVFKFARVGSAYRALIQYIILFPLCLQLVRLVQLAGSVSGKRWDLGSIPRSPIISILFSSTFSCADSKMRCIISLTSQRNQVSLEADPRAKDVGLTPTPCKSFFPIFLT